MSNEVLSYRTFVEARYQETELPTEWDPKAEDSGESIVEARSYEILLVGRSGQIIREPTTSVSYRPRHSAAHGFTVSVEPDERLETESLLTGDAVLFADGEPLQVGIVEKISYNQNDDDYTIEAHAVGHQIEEQAFNRQATNEIVEDVLAKAVHEYNDIIGKHEDMVGTEDETTEGMNTVGGNIYTPIGGVGSGFVRYHFDDSLASSIDLLNFKVYSEDPFEVEIGMDSITLTEEYEAHDEAEYGHWVELPLPSFPPEPFTVTFNLPEGAFLYDWNLLSESRVRTEVEPNEVQTVEKGVFVYEREDEVLKEETAEDEEGEPIISPGVVWGETGTGYRPRNVASWHIFDEDQASSNDNVYFSEIACQGGEWRFTQTVHPYTMNFVLDDEAREWELYARYRLDEINTDDNNSTWDIHLTPNSGEEDVSVPAPSYSGKLTWQKVAGWDDYENWTDSSDDMEMTIETNIDSDVSVYVDCFVFLDGVYEHHEFDDEVHEDRGQLDAPHEYGKGYIQFTPGASSDNITSAMTTTDLVEGTGEPIGRWGPQHRIDADAPWTAEPPNSDRRRDVFEYPGVNHEVRIHITANGTLRNDDTPRRGYRFIGQLLERYDASVDSDDLELFSDYSLSGNRLEVMSSVAGESSHIFRWEGNRAHIFKEGQREADIKLLQEETDSSVSYENVYASVEVIGDGVSSGVIHAPDPPSFVERHKEITDPDITTRQDALRRAASFIVQNSTLRYSGSITTLPTPVPVGEMISGDHFVHGKDMLIESARYSQDRATVSAGYEKRFSDQIIKYSKARASETRRATRGR